MRKKLLNGHELRAVVDNTAFAIGSDPAEYTFYPHTDLHFVRTAYNLGGHPRPLVQLDNSDYIRGERSKLFVCRVDDCVSNNRAFTGKLMINNLPIPAAVRAERPRGEEIPPAGLALCPDQVIALRDLSPEPCD